MTIQQNKIWENSATMWTHVLKYYKNTTTPYGNRANYYRDNGMYKEAMADYNKSIALKDQQPQAYNSRARLFFTVAKGKDTLLLALRDYNKAIEYSPNDGEFYTNRGATYAPVSYTHLDVYKRQAPATAEEPLPVTSASSVFSRAASFFLRMATVGLFPLV